jgi:hypothetical protein
MIVCNPPGFDLAIYEVISAPPSFVGAVNISWAVFVPVATTLVMVGAFGMVGARVGLGEIDAGDAPLLFIAITEKEYKFPGVRPETLAALI